MSVVPFPRQLRLTVSFSVLEDACSLIDRSKEILAAHGGDFDDFWLTADGDWSMTFDVSQRHAEAVFRQLRKLSDFHAENSLDTATPDIENSEPNFRRGWEAVIRSSRLNVASAPKNGHSRSGQVHSAE
jgi:hypothetical protein